MRRPERGISTVRLPRLLLFTAESESLAVQLNLFMLKKLLLVIAIAIGSVTIASAQKVDRIETTVDYMESSARYMEPSQSIMTSPMIADLEVIGGSISYTEIEAFKNYEVTEELIQLVPGFKRIALSRAARAHKADVIIGAMVEVITNKNGRLEITITGYPARYTNFRNATSEDMDLVKKGQTVVLDNSSDVLDTPEQQIKVEEQKHKK